MIVWNDFRNDARVLKEAETLQAAGYSVTVFALHTPGVTEKKQTLASGVKVVRVLRSPLWVFRKGRRPKAPAGASGRFETPGQAAGAVGVPGVDASFPGGANDVFPAGSDSRP